MNLKIWNHIKLSSTTTNNKIQIFQYECPACRVKDFYLCLDSEGIVWCYNCNETLYFKEMIECKNSDLIGKIVEFEIGKIRSKDDDQKFNAEVEKVLFENLQKKYNNGTEEE